MNIPKEIIEKAIEGGWFGGYSFSQDKYEEGKYIFVMADDCTHEQFRQHQVRRLSSEDIAFDPSFWQALGKSLGWNYPVMRDGRWSPEHSLMPNWRDCAQDFYDLILTNKSTDQFWSQLLN